MKKILISILAIIVVFITVSAIVPNRTYAIGLDDMQKKPKAFLIKENQKLIKYCHRTLWKKNLSQLDKY